jgi:hypothetical protein
MDERANEYMDERANEYMDERINPWETRDGGLVARPVKYPADLAEWYLLPYVLIMADKRAQSPSPGEQVLCSRLCRDKTVDLGGTESVQSSALAAGAGIAML